MRKIPQTVPLFGAGGAFTPPIPIMFGVGMKRE